MIIYILVEIKKVYILYFGCHTYVIPISSTFAIPIPMTLLPYDIVTSKSTLVIYWTGYENISSICNK